jgi:hypothetical protein
MDRERTANQLRSAAVEGYLDTGELEERLAEALAARTRPVLAALVEDLPASEPTVPRQPASRSQIRRRLAAFAAFNTTLTGAWLAEVGAHDPWFVGQSDDFPWPVLGVIASGAALCLATWRKRRSAPMASP